jgi:hypothetical protein
METNFKRRKISEVNTIGEQLYDTGQPNNNDIRTITSMLSHIQTNIETLNDKINMVGNIALSNQTNINELIKNSSQNSILNGRVSDFIEKNNDLKNEIDEIKHLTLTNVNVLSETLAANNSANGGNNDGNQRINNGDAREVVDAYNNYFC